MDVLLIGGVGVETEMEFELAVLEVGAIEVYFVRFSRRILFRFAITYS